MAFLERGIPGWPQKPKLESFPDIEVPKKVLTNNEIFNLLPRSELGIKKAGVMMELFPVSQEALAVGRFVLDFNVFDDKHIKIVKKTKLEASSRITEYIFHTNYFVFSDFNCNTQVYNRKNKDSNPDQDFYLDYYLNSNLNPHCESFVYLHEYGVGTKWKLKLKAPT